MLVEFQHKTLQHGLKHIIEFFSADEECIQKDYLVRSAECQSAYKTLDLYLHTSSQLVDDFIRSQNMQQNSAELNKSFGKIHFQVEMKQNHKVCTELVFNLKVFEARDLNYSYDYNFLERPFSNYNGGSSNGNTVPTSNNAAVAHPSNTFVPRVEVFLLGPYNERKWRRKLIRHSFVDIPNKTVHFKDTVFEFKINVAQTDLKHFNSEHFLSNYELQIVLNDSNCPRPFKVNGVAVLNLSHVARSARVWKRLRSEDDRANSMLASENYQKSAVASIDNSVYGCMELWLALRAKLRVNEQGCKILRVLERHADDKRALEFIQLKNLSRHNSKILWN